MTLYRSEFLRTLVDRGFVHQQTDEKMLDERAASRTLSAYIGFDATSDSLHVGSLVQIMLLRHLQQSGHRPIVLMGGGTTKVGDPSGKDETRQLLSDEQIRSNIAGIRKIFTNFLHFDASSTGAVMANNDEWLSDLRYIPFLREVGRHFSINRMLTMDSVKLRLEREQPLSFLEFNYMILQGYDFVELYERYGCTLQMGGSDQWGNILQGVELGRRLKDAELFGVTSPLITTASGAKMGKTAAGAVWLDAKRLPPYDYWQFWRNTEDADVGRFLRMFTELPLPEISRLERLQGAEINEAKKILATEATRLCHGEAAAHSSAETAHAVFAGPTNGGDKSVGDSADTHSRATTALPSISVAEDSQPLVLDVVVQLGMASSRSEARRLIEQGGVRLNDKPVLSVAATVSSVDLDEKGEARLAVGKKRHAIIKRA